MIFVFFFQAEDGIRDSSVTGVQTCALPIAARVAPADRADHGKSGRFGPRADRAVTGAAPEARAQGLRGGTGLAGGSGTAGSVPQSSSWCEVTMDTGSLAGKVRSSASSSWR